MNLPKSFAAAVVLCLFGIAVTCYVPACHPEAHTARAVPAASVASKLRAQGEQVLGRIVAKQLEALADGSLAQDPLHAAAAAAWSAITPLDLEKAINAATEDRAPRLAAEAARLTMKAARGDDVTQADAINAIASVLSSMAFSR